MNEKRDRREERRKEGQDSGAGQQLAPPGQKDGASV